jgi:hypothetical protein
MKTQGGDSVRLDSVVLRLCVGQRVHTVEITKEIDGLLIRIPDYNILDSLPLPPHAASRILERFPLASPDKRVWMDFLTQSYSLERALGLTEDRVASPV